jgi:hypothetical protein
LFFSEKSTITNVFPTVLSYKATSSTYKSKEEGKEKLWSNVKDQNLFLGNTILHFSSFDHTENIDRKKEKKERKKERKK